MNIDLTMREFQIPKLYNYEPPFGTMKDSGGLTTQEVNDNIILPFNKQRCVSVTEDSTTSTINGDARLSFASSGLTLTLGVPTYKGCRITVIGPTSGSSTVVYNDHIGQKTVTVGTRAVKEFVSTDGMTFKMASGDGGSGTVVRFATLVEAQAALLITEGNEGFIPDGALVVVDELESNIIAEDAE